ncbi:MAG: response regulator [Archangium sp.]|nr:response regulator [Archangium sp.]MDP3156369.1 response regulator [Archangium sp.]MDP3570413.1 response regulator [Archangium sp.]
MIVDDDPRLADAVARLLETRGFTVTAFSSPHDALAALRAGPKDFDVVLTDLTMPEMKGQDFISALREICPDMPIIVSTGADLDAQARARLGVREVLLKPWRLDEAVDALRRLQAD